MTKRNGRLPNMVTTLQKAELDAKSSAELASIRADISSMMHAHGAATNRLRVEAEAITAILHAREKREFEVSDHAVVRWLEKVKGVDVTALRTEIGQAVLQAKQEGNGATCRAKGDAVAYTKDEVTFIVAHRNNIVTVVHGRYENPVSDGE